MGAPGSTSTSPGMKVCCEAPRAKARRAERVRWRHAALPLRVEGQGKGIMPVRTGSGQAGHGCLLRGLATAEKAPPSILHPVLLVRAHAAQHMKTTTAGAHHRISSRAASSDSVRTSFGRDSMLEREGRLRICAAVGGVCPVPCAPLDSCWSPVA